MKNIKSITTIKELPEEERPREKLKRFGTDYLSNSELLAILIGTGTKASSALMLANKIISIEKNGIGFLKDCTIEDLSSVSGIGLAKSSQIVAAIELGKRISTMPSEAKLNISKPECVAKLFMEEMRYLKKEFFKVLLLNTKNEIISIEETSVGNLNSSIVHPREVFAAAIKKSAASIILVHNHPSGNPNPSKVDIETTLRLVEAGKILGILVVDHLVIGDGTYVSLQEKMLM